MISTPNSKRLAALATGSALAALSLGGCASIDSPRAQRSTGTAQAALAKGEREAAIELAETAVLADPRNPSRRAALAAAYLDAGRFHAAGTSFADAMQLGDESAPTALGLALAQIASGDPVSAAALLDDWHGDIAPADLGLAFALAGWPDRGAHILSNAIRDGENTARVRQNLAYAYALQGDWRAARIMAAEDLPADKVGDRMAEWASTIRPDLFQHRIARLLDAPVVADTGQPAHLALSNFPAPQQFAEKAAAPLPAGAPEPETTRFAAAAPARAAIRFVSSPMVQDLPDGAERPAPAPRPSARRPVAARTPAISGGAHLVQLGSFVNVADARRAWDVFTRRYPQLGDYRMVVTEARVKGQAYFRVSAGGFQQAKAVSLCGAVKAEGEGCIVWAKGKPLPGAVDRGVRLAAR